MKLLALLRDLPAMRDVADVVASGECVWFIGAGLSLEGKMPSVWDLTWALLNNAFRNRLGPWRTDAACIGLWERMKRLLIGPRYERASRLQYQDSMAGVEAELEKLEKAFDDRTNVPAWAERFLNLGRVAEVFQRAVPDREEADVVLARLMGFEPGPDGTSPMWDKPPLFTHHLLGLLVAEGRIGTMVTTNYDRLIEAACAEMGVQPQVVARRQDLPVGPGVTYYKIHGCRGWYLQALVGSRDELRKACAALVITDRQLQHWRGDDWSREKLKVILRERPVLFIGYSASEPVLQSTLNLIADEEGRLLPERLFVVPEVSFPFYQFFAISQPSYDPLQADNTVNAYGERFMSELYPMVMGRYVGETARQAGAIDWETAEREWRCPGGDVLDRAAQRASVLVAQWAEALSARLVARSRPNRLEASPLALMRPTFAVRPAYVPLESIKAEFQRLVRLFAVMLAFNFPDPALVEAVSASADGLDDVTLRIRAGRTDLRVALMPTREGGRPGKAALAWLQEYFQRRRAVETAGTYIFLVASHLDEAEAEHAWGQIKKEYGDSYSVQIWHLSSVYMS